MSKVKLTAAVIQVMKTVKNIEKNMTIGVGNNSYKGVSDKDVKNIKHFNKLLEKIEQGRNIALLIRRGEMTTFITMKPGDNEE